MEEREFLRKKLMQRTRDKIEEKMAGKEVHIIKAVNLIKDLEAVNNLMNENISDWGKRNPSGEANEMFSELSKNTSLLEEERKKLVEFINKEMAIEFPNFSVLATSIIGAKLLSEAGSKKALTLMPASSLQVLGATKALFAHLKRKATSPKHGHIFNHPLIQKLPKSKRGAASRLIASKLSLALKIDYFNGENKSTEMLKELEEKISLLATAPEKEKTSKPAFNQTPRHTERQHYEKPRYGEMHRSPMHSNHFSQKREKPNFNSNNNENSKRFGNKVKFAKQFSRNKFSNRR